MEDHRFISFGLESREKIGRSNVHTVCMINKERFRERFREYVNRRDTGAREKSI